MNDGYEQPFTYNPRIDPGRFTNIFDYDAAVAKAEAERLGIDPIDPKEASSCLQDEVMHFGGINSATRIGTCAVSECNLLANKATLSCEGFCLKSVVGVRKIINRPITNPKY